MEKVPPRSVTVARHGGGGENTKINMKSLLGKKHKKEDIYLCTKYNCYSSLFLYVGIR